MTSSLRPSRRHVLQAAGAAGLAVGSSLLPASVHAAMAAPLRPGGIGALEHVILLMQENRAFDHYLGSLSGVRGYGDRTPLRRRNGESVLAQPDGDRTVLPFSLREAADAAGRPAGDIQYLGALPHGFTDATAAWAEGWYDGWVPAKGEATMTYYDRADIPLQYELAQTFTTLDSYHCSVFGSTNPNRNYFWSGTTGREADGSRAVTNAAYDYGHPGYRWTTYPERLEAAGISWQIYQEWDNFTDNAVEYFKPFKRVGRKMLAHVDGGFRTTEEFYDSLAGRTPAEQDTMLAQLARGREALTAAERSLFDRAMYRSRPGTLLPRIQADIAAGTLPAVTWIVPTAALSEHPSASTPVGSAGLVHDLLDVVASDLDTWSSTALLLNFDENDGFFDHVPPPVAPRPPSGNDADWYDAKPIGLGPRVPMTIVSPWTVGGYVDSTLADHTSVLRFLETWTGVVEPNISAWRREVCSDLTGSFDWDHRHRPPATAQPGPVPAPTSRWYPEAPLEQALPVQEPGRRRSRAVPYQPTAGASYDGRRLRVRLANTGRSSAVFHVYPYAGLQPAPSSVPVPAQEEVLVTGPVEDRWEVVVQGPNRFWCEIVGRADGAAARVDVRALPTGHPKDRATLHLDLVNDGDHAVSLTLSALAYRGGERRVTVPAHGRRRVLWPTDHGWYDVEVRCAEDAAFRRRTTGRVETGRAGPTA